MLEGSSAVGFDGGAKAGDIHIAARCDDGNVLTLQLELGPESSGESVMLDKRVRQ